jgi:hypothetical protein
MTSTFDVEQFLSTLVMSYKTSLVISEEKISIVIPGTAATIASLSYSKKTKKAELVIVTQQQVVVKPGTIDATEFFTAIKKAGRRPNVIGVLLYTTEQCQRQDEQEAIQAYIGYDNNLAHGTNLDNARTTANSNLKVKKVNLPQDKEYSRSSKPIFDGYVAGMPNKQKKLLNNLIGRVSKGLDDLLEYEIIVANDSISERTRSYNATMVELEKERVQQLNNDIRSLVF